jgi:hypothetical protein
MRLGVDRIKPPPLVIGSPLERSVISFGAKFTTALDDTKDDYRAFHSAETIQELMALPGGAKTWERHGSSWQGTFDLTEGSKNRKLLDAYMAKKAAQKAAPAPETPPGGDRG